MISEPSKLLCYTCIHRRDLRGHCHSACHSPMGKVIIESIGELGQFMRLPVIPSLENKETGSCYELIKGNEHGIKNGWFNWPFNFDPCWLELCEFFTSIEE